ncbi:glycosyltransferase family 2 protein [Sediminibacterium soli]|uniref:glycosyltransferase family 2 protein n=1 Tax=Sediminibacterium soli TaxID=2698829 RepID=UPI0013797E0A|nr:glycosyltransferase family 2 protein [Sediminibacterium soli]NCI45537.1 glycosyltransferase family 2 protein [Sediminibacterium soli]
MRPIRIPPDINRYWLLSSTDADACLETKTQYQRLNKGEPEVSVVIPAYNEESNIVKTLLSLASNTTGRSVEIIVVDNNSKDRTAELIRTCGVGYVLETEQGITPARNRGLREAKGKYILNADADTLYPSHWIEAMTAPLAGNPDLALTYGRFSFIPVGSTGRNTYFFYEYITDMVRTVHRHIREEAVNVYGFNSGFRREQGLAVDGFHHPPGTNEDGWLALKLRNRGFGKLFYARAALVWTTDRRLQIDGGICKAVTKRIKRFFSR